MNKYFLYISVLFVLVFVVGAVAQGTNVVDFGDFFNVKIIEPIESNGGIPVNIQDQTTRPLDLFFLQALTGPTTLATNASFNDTTITVNSSTGCSVGDYLAIFSDTFYFGEIISISVNDIELDTPLDEEFVATSNVICATREMNVNGATTTQIFQVRGPGTAQNFSIDITRIILEMTCTDPPEWTDFCDIAGGLDYGIVLRKQDGDSWNIWNVKSNAEFANLMFDLNVLEQTRPFQVNGLVGRYTFAGQDKHGVAVRLEPGDYLELWIQDDLSSLLSFRIIAEGHVVSD